jgi:hypothetical protein
MPTNCGTRAPSHDEIPVFHDAHQLSLWAAVRALRLKLYDERCGRLVSFAHARR